MADNNGSLFPASVYNLDVTYMADKLARYAGEVQMSVSSNVAFVNEFDMARLHAYLDDIDAAIDYVTKQPQLDLPESHPMAHPIQPPGAATAKPFSKPAAAARPWNRSRPSGAASLHWMPCCATKAWRAERSAERFSP